MRATISFADLSVDRPSLLMQYLAAIGPGTVLCKTSSLDIRHDGTSLELLRARLPHYAFLPIPNAHYTAEEVARIRRANDVVVAGHAPDDPADADFVAFLRTHGLDPGDLLEEWLAQFDLGKPGTADYAARLTGIYQLPQSGPLIIVGAPEDYLGYPPGEPDVTALDHPTELHRLLVESGYARRYRLVNRRKDPEHAGLVIHGTPARRLPISPDDASRPFTDIGVVHLGRTATGRTVMVVASSSHPFGTLGGVRICCDHGRNALQHLVGRFADGERTEVAVQYRVRPQVDGAAVLPLSPTSPIDAEIEVEDPGTVPSELRIREVEVRCAGLRPAATAIPRRTGLLADHLRSRGPVSALVKTYPVDRRDDSTAKDLLESVVPGVHVVPVPENVPHHRAPDANDRALADSVAGIVARAAVPGSLIAMLAGLAGEWWERIEHWRQVLAARTGDARGFPALVESCYRLPGSGPLLILGNPGSFLGADAPAAVAEQPQLAALLATIGHPNRFELLGLDGPQSVLFDHRAIREITVDSAGTGDRDTDVGLIHLTRGPDDRDILVIGGNHWLGTLAGVQLAFADRRPGIDRAVQAYVDGRRRSVDIGYRCRRIAAQPAPLGARFPMCHPAVDLEVELVDEEGLATEFHRSRQADAAFGSLWQSLDARKRRGTAVRFGDGCIAMRLEHREGGRVLRIDCRDVVRLRASGDEPNHTMFCSERTATILAEFRRAVGQARRTYEQDRQHKRHRCYCFLVVGPPGSGKESMGHLLREELGGGRQLAQANVAGLAETLMLSELFGHERNAFTGATEDHPGLFEVVRDGDVCVLDEFAAGSESLQMQFQPALLRFLQFGTGRRIGARTPFHRRMFLLASTNEADTLDGLTGLVRSGRVRADLVDRFGYRFELPPLRERPLEILPTFLSMLSRHRKPGSMPGGAGMLTGRFEKRALQRLLHHGFPGNFRQLEQVAEHVAFDLHEDGGEVVQAASLARALGFDPGPEDRASSPVIDVEVHFGSAPAGETGTPPLPAPPPGPLPEPRPAIAWPTQATIKIRKLEAVDDAVELCRRIAIVGTDDRRQQSMKIHSRTLVSGGPQAARKATRLFDEMPSAVGAAELAGLILDGLVRFGRQQVNSRRFSAPYLTQWVLVALTARTDARQAKRSDPLRAAAMRFLLPTTAWEPLWKHLCTREVAGQPPADQRLLRMLVILLLTGTDLRTAEDIARVNAARGFQLATPRS
ncbi:MAG: hypothetical protein EBZ59_05755 [Planctomycetia bacterium]|nr:hypothetical protein [Planctomycetia bacterium]